jgi:hypothetical protein
VTKISDPEAVMRAKILSVAAVVLVLGLAGCDEPSPSPSPEAVAKPKPRPPAIELRLALDAKESKPEEGIMVGRWELVNHSTEVKEYEGWWADYLTIETVFPDGKHLNQEFPYHGGIPRPPKVTKLAPGESATGTFKLSYYFHALHWGSTRNNEHPLGVYQARLVFRYQAEEVRSNWLPVNQQAQHSQTWFIGSAPAQAAGDNRDAAGR